MPPPLQTPEKNRGRARGRLGGSAPARIITRTTRLSAASELAVRARRVLWSGRAESWDQQGSQNLTAVFAAVLAKCSTTPKTVAVDLGCGSGQITLPLAERCASVLAVDVSAEMIDLLAEKMRETGAQNLQLLTQSMEALDLEPDSVDLVVTNYALHHLRDADKHEVLHRAFRWLRPDGQLVIGDMMFGRSGSSRDRRLILGKIRHMLGHGPAGWWRILKNLWRFSLRVSEKPLTAQAWEALVREAGFTAVAVEPVVEEACVLSARKPQHN